MSVIPRRKVDIYTGPDATETRELDAIDLCALAIEALTVADAEWVGVYREVLQAPDTRFSVVRLHMEGGRQWIEFVAMNKEAPYARFNVTFSHEGIKNVTVEPAQPATQRPLGGGR